MGQMYARIVLVLHLSVLDSLCVRSMASGYQLAKDVITIAIMREVGFFTGENIIDDMCFVCCAMSLADVIGYLLELTLFLAQRHQSACASRRCQQVLSGLLRHRSPRD